MRRLRALLLATACVLPAVATATATASAATTVPLTTVTADTPLSAYGGWVVWSEQDPDGRWALVAWHDGARTRLAAAPRSVPFDADVGPDAHGRPVVTFSRCAVDPSPREFDQPWSTARGCRLDSWDLARGREDVLAVPRPAGASDSTPSRWRGRVAFQRRTAGADVAQVMVEDLATHRLRRLPHGAVPHHCPYATGCAKARYRGEVGELDLGARTLAFSWHVQAPSVEGAGAGWELRADALGGGATVRAGSGYVSGACGGRAPFSPNATAGGVAFLDRTYKCEGVEGTITATAVTSGVLSTARAPDGGVAWRIARDGASTYAVLGPGHVGAEPLAPGALRLVRLDGLKLTSAGRRATTPFFE